MKAQVAILKVPQNSENKPRGLCFSKALFGGLIFGDSSMEGNLHFKIFWASLIVGRKFTIFALFYFVFEGNLRVPAHGGSLYLEGLVFGIL